MTVDELKIILRVNGASTYTHTINEVTNVTNNYKNTIGSLTSMLAKLVSAAAITKFSKQCIDAASQLQEVSNVTEVAFGKSAAVVNDWAKSQAANFGLSETSAKRYIGTYGTMAKQFNMTSAQAAAMGIELTKLTGDVASFYNIDDKTAAVKLKSVFTGETESLKELGVVMTETQLNSFAMSRGINKAVKDMSEQEKVLLRYQFTLDKLSHAQGDFARTSGSWANSVRTLNLNLENLKVQIGNELIPVAAQGLSYINSGLQAVSPILIGIAQTVRYYGEAWKNASESTKSVVKASITALAIAAAAPRIITLVSNAVKILTVQTLTLGGALSAIAGIAGLILAGIALADLTKQVNELKTADKAKALDTLGNSAGVTADAVDDLAGSIDSLSDAVEGMELFLASFDEVNKVGDNGSLMSGLVNSDDLANISGAIDGIEELNSIMDSVEVPDISQGSFLDPEWWKGKLSTLWGHVKSFVQSFFNGDWKENWELGAGYIYDALKKHIPKITAFMTEIGYSVQNAVAKVKEFYNNNIEPIVESSVKFFKDWIKLWEDIGGAIFDATENLKEFLKGMEEAGASYWDKSHDAEGNATTWPAKLLDKMIGANRYAAGGFPNKGSLFLAGESGAELVGNFGGSQTKVINQSQITNNSEQPILFQPTILIDGRKITATVVDNINTMTRSSGNSPLIQLG